MFSLQPKRSSLRSAMTAMTAMMISFQRNIYHGLLRLSRYLWHPVACCFTNSPTPIRTPWRILETFRYPKKRCKRLFSSWATPHSKAKDETASHPCKVFPAPIFFYRACSIFSGRSAAISGSVFRRRIRKGFTKRRRDSWLQRFFGGGGLVAKWLQGVVPKLGWENWVPTWQIVRCQHEIVRKRHLKFCFLDGVGI